MINRPSNPPVALPVAEGSKQPIQAWAAWFQSIREALVGSSLLLDKQSLTSAVSSVTLEDGIGLNYDQYQIDLINLTFSAATLLKLQISTDGGTTFHSAGTDYSWGAHSNTLTTIATDDFDGLLADSAITLLYTNTTNASNSTLNGHIIVSNPQGSNYTTFQWNIGYNTAGGDLVQVKGMGQYKATTSISAIKLFPASGNISSGKVKLTALN